MELKEWGPKLVKKDGANLSRYAFAYSGANGYIDWSFQNNIWGWGGSYSDENFQVKIAEKPAIDAGRVPATVGHGRLGRARRRTRTTTSAVASPRR